MTLLVCTCRLFFLPVAMSRLSDVQSQGGDDGKTRAPTVLTPNHMHSAHYLPSCILSTLFCKYTFDIAIKALSCKDPIFGPVHADYLQPQNIETKYLKLSTEDNDIRSSSCRFDKFAKILR